MSVSEEQVVNFKKYINEKNEQENDGTSVSSFWSKQNALLGNEIIPKNISNCRNWKKRRGMGNNTNDRQWAQNALERLNKKNISENDTFVIDLKESDFGNPYKLQTKYGLYSGMFLLNIMSTYDINKLIKKYTNTSRLNICEIGCGWGQCQEILSQKLNINKYISIDLKETLILSYLNACYNYNGNEVLLFDGSTDTKRHTYLTPNHIHKIKDTFDVIINYFSFQEMSLKNVNFYIDFIKKVMNDDSIFISSNGFDMFEIKKFTELGYLNFDIVYVERDNRSPYKKQLLVCMRKRTNKKYVHSDIINRLAVQFRKGSITSSEFMKCMYE